MLQDAVIADEDDESWSTYHGIVDLAPIVPMTGETESKARLAGTICREGWLQPLAALEAMQSFLQEVVRR